MRDIALTGLLAIAVLFVFRRPWWGILLLAWLGYMNPQRLCYGFGYTFPFFYIVAVCTGISILVSSEAKHIPKTREIWLLLCLIIWMNVTQLFALNPTGAWWEWDRMMKTMVFVFMSLMVMVDRKRLELLVWAIVLSFGFYGVKGGLFTVARGGNNSVVGPEASFIGDNNQLAVALAMTLPLIRYLQLQSESRRIRIGLTGMMVLTSLAILGTYSRAGAVSLGVVALVMWAKSRRKLLFAFTIPVCGMLMIGFMPEKWTERMHSMKSYDEDASTLGRFNAWRFAYNLANDRPLTGGGFYSFTPELFRRYAPDAENFHAAHSIYFQMLGDHGYPGLFLFVAFFGLTWLRGNWVRRHARPRPDLLWASDMTAMLQTSLAVYMVGGATLSLAYFDLPYQLGTMIVMCKVITQRQLQESDVEEVPEQTIELIPSTT